MDLAPVIFGCQSTVLSVSEADFFRRANPFGFILFGRNIENPNQLRALTQSIRDAVGWNAPILIDQEGGRVARMVAPHWQEVPPALTMAEGQNSARAFWLRGRVLANQLNDVGIDVNCAPVLDIARPDTHPVLENRCYGKTADTVIKNARAFAEGQEAGGVMGVIKHIPGHGLSTMDSHHELPTVTTRLQDLENVDFAPFKAFSQYPMGMSAHLVFEALDANAPATQSVTMISYIRAKIGFEGLLMTDDISMNALKGTVGERSAAALQAGCDCILHCNGIMDEMIDVANVATTFSAEGQKRAEKALNARPQRQNVDISALWDELAEIIE